MQGKKNNVYVLLLLLVCLIFGFTFIATKDLLKSNFPAFLLIAVRFIIGTTMLFIIGKIIRVPKITKDEIKYGVIIGAVIFVGFAFQTVGLMFTSPANSGLLTGLNVVFVPLIIMVATRKLYLKSVLIALFCFLGAAIVSGVFTQGFEMNLGDVLTVCGAVAFAVMFILLEMFSYRFNPLNLTVVQLSTVACLALVFSLFTETAMYSGIAFESSILGLLYLGVLASGFAYFIQTFVQTKISATTTSVVCLSESVFAVMFAVTLGYDAMSLSLLVGSAIILASTAVVSLSKDSMHFERK